MNYISALGERSKKVLARLTLYGVSNDDASIATIEARKVGRVLEDAKRLPPAVSNQTRKCIEMDAEFKQALAFHQAGRLTEAEQIYRQILQAQPKHFDSMHLLGVITAQRGNQAEAVRQIDAALEIDPNYALAHNNRGNALRELQRLDEALASYDRAIALNPDLPEASHNRANTLRGLKRLDEALASYDRAIAIKPDYAEAFNDRGNALRELERLDEALASYDRAVALKPDLAEAFNNRGVTLRELERLDEALASYDRAVALKPDLAEAFNNRGVTLGELERLDDAVASYDRAIVLKPDYAEAFNNRGTALRALERLDEALASYERAIALKPDYAKAFANRGNALSELKRLDEALASYNRAITLKPDFAEAHFSRSLVLLLKGNYADGWDEYEWRYKGAVKGKQPRNFECPQWRGEDLTGKTIFLHSEQGYGDTIQFLRYVPLVASRGGRVILEVPPPLLRLAERLQGAVQVFASGVAPAAVDFFCPLLSLPRAFGTTVATIPGEVPYLTVDPVAVAAWRRRVADLKGLRVGLVWAGNPRPNQPETNGINRRRSVTLGHFATLAHVPGVSFVSLQKDQAASQTSPPRGLLVHDWTDELDDFADTAALIEALDLVISVDTSVVHLAGAIGKPVWLLNRCDTCWRWLLDRHDSPWYPTLRQFRQPKPSDWDSVMIDLQTALIRLTLYGVGNDEASIATVDSGI